MHPQGSTFDELSPGLGVAYDEKGRQKKGVGNFSQVWGKYSRDDYSRKFAMTGFEFSMPSMMSDTFGGGSGHVQPPPSQPNLP